MTVARCEPTLANSAVDEPPLTTAQVASWRDQGFAVVEGLLPADLVERVRLAGHDRFPGPGTDAAEATVDFGSSVNFPSRLDGVDELTLHPRLLGTVSQLLDTPISNLRLTQSDLWPKYGRTSSTGRLDNQDQRIHLDYPNHSLAHPAPWDRPEAVEMIVYFSDHAECGGSTAVVPRRGAQDPAYRSPLIGTPGVGTLDYVNDRERAERSIAEQRPDLADWRQQLYRREQLTNFSPGTILLYRHDVWHRGTPLTPGSIRLTQNITYRRAECEWISTLHVGWAWAMYSDDKHMERLIARCSLEQRAVLGFPQPGNTYWCDETIAAVEARHGPFGMDMTPYREARAFHPER